MSGDQARLARIERALHALGELALSEGTWGSERQERQDELRAALDALGPDPVGDTRPTGQAETTAPGATLDNAGDNAGAATDPIPANMQTHYLSGEDTQPNSAGLPGERVPQGISPAER